MVMYNNNFETKENLTMGNVKPNIYTHHLLCIRHPVKCDKDYLIIRIHLALNKI